MKLIVLAIGIVNQGVWYFFNFTFKEALIIQNISFVKKLENICNGKVTL